jgi:hypothetical protein
VSCDGGMVWEGKGEGWFGLTGLLTRFYIKGGLGLKLGQGCVGWVERIRIVDWIWWLFLLIRIRLVFRNYTRTNFVI